MTTPPRRAGSDTAVTTTTRPPFSPVEAGAAIGLGVDRFGDQQDRAGGKAEEAGLLGVGVAGGDVGGGARIVRDAETTEHGGDRARLLEDRGELAKAALLEPARGAR